jgi:hypothetical protein
MTGEKRSTWVKDVGLILAFLGGTNGAQYFGIAKPAQVDLAAIQSRETELFELLKQKDKQLQECWLERARECRR